MAAQKQHVAIQVFAIAHRLTCEVYEVGLLDGL